MKVETTKLDGLLILHPQVFGDERGWFMESFNQYVFDDVTGTNYQFVQDNHSKSSHGVLRGLHYQLPPKAQGKLVRVLQGKVWDVAVDIRKNSPTFGQWIGVELSAENKTMFWIPPGFAHGFITLSETAELLYKTTNFYSPEHERCIMWSDSDLKIEWGESVIPILSEKDKQGVSFLKADYFN
ncbi:dTDP-4-dehydrorhamnose 3,5-epimerase [Acinetobacter johnsonii]|uniref:dTDP-4-dehydrorhamnose 3,5-epimerase n=1 Tax=Acinetobacter johnsonii TaxID=40214 RepID=A0A3S9APW5_ACIJO|nr:dTDP-4-dehydrorhamnose 3,5-epimerase [Acinetobacter johnsonii]AZN65685.1 dTDP-4-dehydrorhamnose 3,5-epimerase [Acinetobacter johnsonii]